MAQRFIKGLTNNHLTWVMVDATDFATPESNASTASIKIYGKLRSGTGVNFVSSGTGSLTNDIVHVGASATGIYTIALAKADLSDASAAWYDQYIITLTASGCARQTLVVDGGIIESSLSDLISNAYSAALQANSRVLLVQSSVSDIYSALSDFQSDFQSRVPKRIATDSQLSDVLSDLRSFIGAGVAMNASDMSDIRSAIAAGPAATVTASDISDIASAVRAILVSDLSDILSAVRGNSDALSDLLSRLNSASFLSDIASHVWAAKYTANSAASSFGSLFSDIGSRLALAQSNISDVQSYLVVMSGMLSDTHSAAILGASNASDAYSAALIIQSQLSDLDSRLASDVSDILSVTRGTSDYLSKMSDVLSNAYSGVQLLESAFIGHTGSTASQVANASQLEIDGIDHDDQFNGYYIKILGGSQVDELRLIVDTVKASSTITVKPAFNSRLASAVDFVIVAGNPLQSKIYSDLSSQISDTGSDLRSYLVGMSGMLSDVYSAAVVTQSGASDAASAAAQANSRILLVQSRLSDLDSRLTSDVSDIMSALTVIDGRVLTAQSYASDAHSAAALMNTAQAEVTGVPAASDTPMKKIGFLYEALRNKVTVTSTKMTFFDDADVAQWEKDLSDDGTTYTETEGNAIG